MRSTGQLYLGSTNGKMTGVTDNPIMCVFPRVDLCTTTCTLRQTHLYYTFHLLRFMARRSGSAARLIPVYHLLAESSPLGKTGWL